MARGSKSRQSPPAARTSATAPQPLVVHRAGRGRPALFIHGSGANGAPYLELASRLPGYELLAPDRPNHGESPDISSSSFDLEAQALADLIRDGGHVVGQSYGGALALLIASRWPERVLSLTVHEPPAFRLAIDDVAVQQLLRRFADIYPARPAEDPTDWNRRWAMALDMAPDEAPLDPAEVRSVTAMMREQTPWEADIDLDRIASAPFPKLVVSGGWHAAFEAVCDAIAERTGATRAAFPGTGHAFLAKQDLWLPLVQEMWTSIESGSPRP